jgi:hypothetical protein
LLAPSLTQEIVEEHPLGGINIQVVSGADVPLRRIESLDVALPLFFGADLDLAILECQ